MRTLRLIPDDDAKPFRALLTFIPRSLDDLRMIARDVRALSSTPLAGMTSIDLLVPPELHADDTLATRVRSSFTAFADVRWLNVDDALSSVRRERTKQTA